MKRPNKMKLENAAVLLDQLANWDLLIDMPNSRKYIKALDLAVWWLGENRP